MLVYDITVKESFEKVNYWLGQIRMSAPKDIVILIVGNKIDRENERKISKEQVAHFCSENKLLHEEASAKDDMNVSQLFRNLAIGKALPDSRDREGGSETRWKQCWTWKEEPYGH